MENPNLIAQLRPADSEQRCRETWEAMRLNLCIPESIPPQEEICSRESTAPLEDDQAYDPDNASYPRLDLAFKPGPKENEGFVFGWDPGCDIVLPRLKSISRRHCVLKFDDQRRVILRDISSTGTIVFYDNQGAEMRRRFTWILDGHDLLQDIEKIVLQIHKHIRFQITIARHDESPDLYNENVDIFEMGALGLRSAGSSIAPTPRPQDPIRLEQEMLGQGTFAVVRRYWDVSTGLEYAYKEPLDKRRFDKKAWEKEAGILKQISHDHVVKLLEDRLDPCPLLALEYVPFGSLADQLNNISDAECVTILRQTLSALVELHGRKEPIVHRDIKPANVLIHSRYPLHIKLTDFGLARASEYLTTLCGTKLYLAPEVYDESRRKYTPAVDIWSLGVMVYELAYGLPNHRGYWGTRWCRRIVEKVNDWDSEDLINFLSTAMLVMDPKGRRSAQYCYQEALRLPVPSEGRCLTPTPASSAAYAPTVVYDPVEEQILAGQANQPVSFNSSPDEALAPKSTWRSSQHEGSIRSDMTRRYVRSEGPPPDSYTTRKRSTRSSTSSSTSTSSSSDGRHAKHNTNSSRCSKRAESEPVIDLFGEGWLKDPNCVGSSVAAMGEEEASYASSWSTKPIPRSIPESVPEQNGYYDPHYGEDAVTQDAYVNTGVQGGDALVQDAYVVDTAAQGADARAWANSDEYMAAHLLYAIHEGKCL